MTKNLPKILKLAFFLLLCVTFIGFAKPNIAQAQTLGTTTPSPSPSTTPAGGTWVQDQEVTFVGKTAARANDFLQWTLQNYNWISVPTGQTNPLETFWALVRNIVYAFLALFVLGSAIVMIVTRGQNLTVMKFIPRFVIILLLVVLSFAIVRFLYQVVDAIQGYFLTINNSSCTNSGDLICTKDLLSIAFDYANFTGYRQLGLAFDESAFISLLLVKLTAITYYVMTGILLIRKIILWFFIVVSPIFPLLLFFRPVRNTAKIWVGEFFRWLLYAPLFAIFLHGLVVVWKSPVGIPLHFVFSNGAQSIVYPTAINILLGGPGQAIDINNSVNYSDTFALYVVALLMLWVVILLPFLLLQIFLDYLNGYSFTESPLAKKITSNSWFNKAYGGRPSTPGQPPTSPSPFGAAKALPFFNKRAMEIPNQRAATTLEQASLSSLQTVRETKDVMRLANLSIPKMRDIARYETSMLKHDSVSRSEVSKFHDTLEKISKPATVGAPGEREKFVSIKDKLVSQQKKGDKLADNVLKAGKVSDEVNNKTKAVIPGQKEAGLTNIKDVSLPKVNNTQQVSIEEYEDVKKMWQENYQNMETPQGPNGLPMDKHTFISQDVDNITETINLLSSEDQNNVDRGMERVANILPFLLLGGFSKSEVISYLKAKLEAAKSVLSGVDKKQEDEDTMLERDDKTTSRQAEMAMHEELPEDEKVNQSTEIPIPTQNIDADATNLGENKNNSDSSENPNEGGATGL